MSEIINIAQGICSQTKNRYQTHLECPPLSQC